MGSNVWSWPNGAIASRGDSQARHEQCGLGRWRGNGKCCGSQGRGRTSTAHRPKDLDMPSNLWVVERVVVPRPYEPHDGCRVSIGFRGTHRIRPPEQLVRRWMSNFQGRAQGTVPPRTDQSRQDEQADGGHKQPIDSAAVHSSVTCHHFELLA